MTRNQPATQPSSTELALDRREFGQAVFGTASAGILSGVAPANAEVFFDPAMYGDQELRVGTVDSVRERTRRAILQNPKLAPSFYQLALLDGLIGRLGEAQNRIRFQKLDGNFQVIHGFAHTNRVEIGL